MKNSNSSFESPRAYAMRASHFLVLALFTSVLGCKATNAREPNTPAVSVSQVDHPAAPSAYNEHANGAKPLPQAVSALAAEGVTGAIALYDSRDDALFCSDDSRCARQYSPASTFAVPLSAIALETSALNDAESSLPWDGNPYTNPDWNHDHTLRSALQTSCEPCFRALARKIGDPSVRDWLGRFDYGNHDTGGGVEAFWLRGALRITPFQQIDFLRRLEGAKLPVREHTLDVLRDVITLDVAPDYVLRGKLGSATPPDDPSEVGWFIGFVELGERRVFFATVLDGHSPGVDPNPVRRRVTEQVLRTLGDLPTQ